MATKSKAKPHKGLLKRVRVTGRGKVKFHKIHAGHLKSSKPPKRLRQLRRKQTASTADVHRLQKVLSRRIIGVKVKRRPSAVGQAAAPAGSKQGGAGAS